jgi:hypothetical protein
MRYLRPDRIEGRRIKESAFIGPREFRLSGPLSSNNLAEFRSASQVFAPVRYPARRKHGVPSHRLGAGAVALRPVKKSPIKAVVTASFLYRSHMKALIFVVNLGGLRSCLCRAAR